MVESLEQDVMSGEVEKCQILHVRPKFDVFTLRVKTDVLQRDPVLFHHFQQRKSVELYHPGIFSSILTFQIVW